jgi:hypothetical protein
LANIFLCIPNSNSGEGLEINTSLTIHHTPGHFYSNFLSSFPFFSASVEIKGGEGFVSGFERERKSGRLLISPHTFIFSPSKMDSAQAGRGKAININTLPGSQSIVCKHICYGLLVHVCAARISAYRIVPYAFPSPSKAEIM